MQLARVAGIGAPAASAHLARLVEGGLVAVHPQGRHRYHRLASAAVAATLEALGSGRRTVTEADLVNFAGISGDYFYAHTDEIAARDSYFGRRVAHGYFVISAAAGLFVDPAPGPVIANYGLDGLRFVRVGSGRPRAVSPDLHSGCQRGHRGDDHHQPTRQQAPRSLVLDEGVDEVVGGDDVISGVGAILPGFECHSADRVAERSDLPRAQHQHRSALAGTDRSGEVA